MDASLEKELPRHSKEDSSSLQENYNRTVDISRLEIERAFILGIIEEVDPTHSVQLIFSREEFIANIESRYSNPDKKVRDAILKSWEVDFENLGPQTAHFLFEDETSPRSSSTEIEKNRILIFPGGLRSLDKGLAQFRGIAGSDFAAHRLSYIRQAILHEYFHLDDRHTNSGSILIEHFNEIDADLRSVAAVGQNPATKNFSQFTNFFKIFRNSAANRFSSPDHVHDSSLLLSQAGEFLANLQPETPLKLSISEIVSNYIKSPENKEKVEVLLRYDFAKTLVEQYIELASSHELLYSGSLDQNLRQFDQSRAPIIALAKEYGFADHPLLDANPLRELLNSNPTESEPILGNIINPIGAINQFEAHRVKQHLAKKEVFEKLFGHLI